MLAVCASPAWARGGTNFGNVEPLGDSITWGDGLIFSSGIYGQGDFVHNPVPGGYRAELFSNLIGVGATFQFVGTVTDNSTPALDAAGQAAHEGHPGFTIGQLDPELDSDQAWLTGTDARPAIFPDSFLVMAGTNDMLANIDPTLDVTSVMDSFLHHLVSLRPLAHYYISDLLPIPGMPAANANVPIWDNLLAAEMGKYQGEGFFFTEVHSNAAFLNADGSANLSLSADGVHPTQAGYNLLGDVWTTAMLAGGPLDVTGAVRLCSASATAVSLLTVGDITVETSGSLAIDAVPHRTIVVTSLLSVNGQMDLAGNDLIVHNGNLSDIVSDILAGRITTAPGRTLGVIQRGGSFDGQGVDSTDVLIGSTLVGDTNLDGSVDFSDLLTLAQSYGMSDTSWAQGDFDYDGSTNFSDLLGLAQNYGQSLSTLQVNELASAGGSEFVSAWNRAEASLPEPGELMLGVGAWAMLPRRRQVRH